MSKIVPKANADSLNLGLSKVYNQPDQELKHHLTQMKIIKSDSPRFAKEPVGG